MESTKTNMNGDETAIAYDMATLQKALNCGRYTAEKIASEAGAKIRIGKRIIYDRRKIEDYLYKKAGA